MSCICRIVDGLLLCFPYYLYPKCCFDLDPTWLWKWEPRKCVGLVFTMRTTKSVAHVGERETTQWEYRPETRRKEGLFHLHNWPRYQETHGNPLTHSDLNLLGRRVSLPRKKTTVSQRNNTNQRKFRGETSVLRTFRMSGKELVKERVSEGKS